MVDKPLDNKAADEMYKHTGIDGLISNPAGAQIVAEGEANAQRADQAELEVKLLREKYNLHAEEDSFHNLCVDEVDTEVYNRQAWAMSEEGEQALREGVIEELSQKPKSRSSDEIYQETFQARKKREYAEEQARKREE